MAAPEHSGARSTRVDPGGLANKTTMAAIAAVLGAVVLGVAAVIACVSYQTIARIEHIQDARAGQVTEFFVGSLLLVWLLGVVVVGRRGVEPVARGLGLFDALMRSRVHRRFIAGTIGICVVALLVGGVTIAVACSSAVVTPPAAFLVMFAAGGLGAVGSVQIVDAFARHRPSH